MSENVSSFNFNLEDDHRDRELLPEGTFPAQCTAITRKLTKNPPKRERINFKLELDTPEGLIIAQTGLLNPVPEDWEKRDDGFILGAFFANRIKSCIKSFGDELVGNSYDWDKLVGMTCNVSIEPPDADSGQQEIEFV